MKTACQLSDRRYRRYNRAIWSPQAAPDLLESARELTGIQVMVARP
jgi:hypothetical protein